MGKLNTNERKPAIQYKDGQRLLYEGSFRAVGFNIILAVLLGIYLYHHSVPSVIVFTWLALLLLVTALRMIHCKLVVKREYYITDPKLHLIVFCTLVLITGLIWTSIYFATLPYINTVMEFVIFLVFAGMCAGATASLGIYPRAFILYVAAIFMPVIFYNFYFFDFDKAVISIIFLFYLLAAIVIAKSFQRLLTGVFYLTEQNEILINKLEELSITDSLTALYNKRHFVKIIKDEYYRAKRNEQSFAFVTIDVDNFKLINDNFGHPFGDKFLTYIAYYLRSYLRRENDIIFRLGGDEFAALLVDITEDSAISISKEIQGKFLKIPGFDYQPHDEKHMMILEQVSLSVGVVYVPFETQSTISQITETADKLLYQAKHHGKHQVKYIRL